MPRNPVTHQLCDWVNAINLFTINAFNIWPLTYVNAQCATKAIKLASQNLKKKMFLHNKKKNIIRTDGIVQFIRFVVNAIITRFHKRQTGNTCSETG